MILAASRLNALVVGNRSSNQRYECHLGIPRLQIRMYHKIKSLLYY